MKWLSETAKTLKKYLFRILNVKLMIALVLYAVIWLLRMHIDNSTVLFTAMKILAEQKGHTLPAYADFTGDGKVTAYDAAMIAKYLAEQSLKN